MTQPATELRKRIMEFHDKGFSHNQIAREVNRTTQRVQQIVKDEKKKRQPVVCETPEVPRKRFTLIPGAKWRKRK